MTESEASLDAMMADAARVKAEGDAERLFDAEIALDGDPAKALDALVNLRLRRATGRRRAEKPRGGPRQNSQTDRRVRPFGSR